MNLVPVHPQRGALYCSQCQLWHSAEHTYADLDGKPFESYYCEACAAKARAANNQPQPAQRGQWA